MSTPQRPHARRRLYLLVALTLGALGSASAQTATPPAAAPAVATPVSPELQARLDQGNAALVSQSYKTAQAAFEAAVALDYRSFDAHFGLGLALFNLNDLVGARFEFSQLVGLAPERVEGYYNLGVVQAKAGDRAGAIANLQKAAEVGKGKVLNDVQIGTLRALAAQQSAGGAYADAAKTLKDALDLEPGDAEIALLLAENLYQSTLSSTPAVGTAAGSSAAAAPANATALSDALTYAYQVLNQDPGNLRATTLIADVYVGQKLPARALSELVRSAQDNPDELEKAKILFKKAQVLQGLGRNQEAIAALQDSTRLDPSNGIALYQLGRLLLAAGVSGSALEALQKAATQNPQSPEISLALAFAFDARATSFDAFKRPQDALEARNQAYKYAVASTKLTSDAALIASANLLAGKAAYNSKQYAIAKRLLAGASSGEALTWLGLTNYALKDYAGAIVALEAASKALPTNATVQANLGASYLAARRFSEAQGVLESLVRRSPGYAEAWYNLGWALRNLSRDNEARAAFKKASDLGYAAASKEVNFK